MICYIGSFSKIHDEEGIARSFEALGKQVDRYEERRLTAEDVDEIIDKEPEFVLFAKLKSDEGARKYLLDQAKKHRIKTVCWVPDLYFGTGRHYLVKQSDQIFRADHVFTPDGGNDEQWKKYGVNHHLLRQGIYAPEAVKGDRQPIAFQIVFVGSKNPEFRYRTHLMNKLSARYGELFSWIGRTHSDQARGLQLNDMFASVKVVIGDSVYSPRYWSNRIYETLGRGGFMIHPRIEGLEEDFTYYKHFVPYDYGDFDGLFEKIEYYLTHDREREYIRDEGLAHVKENHTLIHRCQSLLKSVS